MNRENVFENCLAIMSWRRWQRVRIIGDYWCVVVIYGTIRIVVVTIVVVTIVVRVDYFNADAAATA